MKAILIVNADDFGLSEGTNDAILQGHRRGIITSTSLLANGLAFDHAVALAKAAPTLDVGVHLTLTEGAPVAEHVEALLAPDGKLPLSNQPFARALIAGRLPREAIRREFAAQVAKIVDSGLRPTHIDGHKYIHLLPGITAIAVEVARRFRIRGMRIPRRLADSLSRPARLPGLLAIGALGALAYPAARDRCVPDRFMGFMDTGHLDHGTLRRLLSIPRPGCTELLCHPAHPTPALSALGYDWIAGYAFEAEAAAVGDPAIRREAEAVGWQFGNFGEMA
ncbi:MAG TPA: ChbG/HpnK family deacetylase [Aggregatilineales bacterium]|nr:ChbG/HpnK family deacetylase [Aggregatilineales bacterium]